MKTLLLNLINPLYSVFIIIIINFSSRNTSISFLPL